MILVVAALLVRDGRLLIARRPEGKHLPGMWEFPGGKVEWGETPREALERELHEELGVRADAGKMYDACPHRYPEREVMLLFYRCRLISGEPRALEATEIAWALPEELAGYAFAPADEALIRKIAEEGISCS